LAESTIPQALIEAYQTTNFNVLTEPSFTLNIGEKSKEILEVFRMENHQAAAFITAWNPRSQETSKSENDNAQERLRSNLETGNFTILDGLGIDPTGDWLGEPSVLVMGISRNAASEIGIEFRQNAIVWIGKDGIPELVTLR